MAKQEQQLTRLKEKILADDPTPELRTGATQLVFADGNPQAEIVFIGEAPGKKEDQQGLPFVGAAGKFLDEMLDSIGLDRSSVYITNIVKYRPPNNRDPLPDEKQLFWPYLVKQLQIIRPKLLVTLGRHSMEYFLPNTRISQNHGRPKRLRFSSSKIVDSRSEKDKNPNYKLLTTNYETVVVLPLYHPAAALYNGGMRQTLTDDFAKIPLIIKKITTKD